ncbi:hypothetical protein T484DRAFT_2021578 [Baffinella frigidus]|nr:hypothetical protein T484DRAFT_2021578 [Cryptophyta sp. CCMP2293]
MIAFTVLAILLCSKSGLDISFDTSMGIVSVGTTFPLVFSVSAGFERREAALNAMARFKGGVYATYIAMKLWERDAVDGQKGEWADQLDQLFHKLLDDIEWYLRNPLSSEESGNVVYDGFQRLTVHNRDFGPVAGHKLGSGGMGRMSSNIRDLVDEFEQMRSIRDSTSPIGLRLFCFALINVLPIVLAPYWLHFCDTDNSVASDNNRYGCQSAYFVAVAFVTIIVTLYRVQCELEDPFDGKGDDDVRWEEWRAQLDQLSSYGSDGPEKRDSMLLHHLNSAVS